MNGWILVLTSGIHTSDLPKKEVFFKKENQVLVSSNGESRFLPKVDDDLEACTRLRSRVISYIRYNAAI